MLARVLAGPVLFCSDSDKAAELRRPVKLPLDRLGALLSGCSGCAGSALRVRDTPKRSWASVASMTVRSHSQVGFKWDSKYNCGI